MQTLRMPRRWPVVTALSVLIVMLGGKAEAGPPFVTDDPETVEYQHWEFYIASQDIRIPGDLSGTGPHFELNYGVVPNVQLHLIAPLAYDAPSGGNGHYGFGDLELGVKIRFVQESERMPQVGIFPLLEVPVGSASENLGNGHATAFLPVWLQKSWGKWTVYGGGGYGINSGVDNQNWGFAGLVVQKQVTENLLIGAEIYHQTAAQTDFPSVGTAFNVGAVIDLSKQHHLLFSVGRSIDGPTNFQCYVAYQFTFDNSLFHFWANPRP
jgi:Putative MetA-pathway of phenol degradation